ncbi:MAG: nitrogen fixation protein NifEH, partial [archaeon]|nr:nitrogen fixation protein NifEH [archaeon]
MFQIAIYGKGGIGKSTMAANISVALAYRKNNVMQIGCDPKHDSTRLLLGGKAQKTVLEYVRETPPAERRLSDIMVQGSGNVQCVEAGGPEPGIGCAGRGILTTFDMLRKLGCDRVPTDYRIFDVLGDVVCGGFAVPLRAEYADGVILVTSGEFMSLYAANNIMRGMRNFDTGKPRLIGMILNSRGTEGEKDAVERFSKAVKAPILGIIPRDRSFSEAEASGKTVREMFPERDISKIIDGIVDRIVDAGDGTVPMVYPEPLDEDQLSDLAAGRDIRPKSSEEIPRTACCGCSGPRKTIKGTKTLSSCAAYGALAAYSLLNDFAIVMHGPRSCTYLMETTRTKAVMELFERGIYDTPPHMNTYTTMMDDTASIFGGTDELEKGIENAINDGFRHVAVVTTCMPGITGDDCLGCIGRVRSRNPDIDIHYVPADGDMAGDYNGGFIMSLQNMVQMVDTSVEKVPGTVNLIGSSFFNFQSPSRKRELVSMLDRFGLKVNCRFLDEGCSDDIVNYCRAELDLVVSDTPTTKDMVALMENATSRKPFPVPIPVGR